MSLAQLVFLALHLLGTQSLQDACMEAGASAPPARAAAALLQAVTRGQISGGDAEDTSAASFVNVTESAQVVEEGCAPVPPRQASVPAGSSFGSLHEIVGPDGVLMITLGRDQARFNSTVAGMREAGIFPTLFPASDYMCTPSHQLEAGCQSHCTLDNKAGDGCKFKSHQAVADSHRQALLAAARRKEEWTAIFEDDTEPVMPEKWNIAFANAWKHVPPTAKLVRLGACMAKFDKSTPSDNGFTLATYSDSGTFRLTQFTGYNDNYLAGGCTHAYMVHRSFISEMLSIFPCCAPLDVCLEWDLLNKVVNASTKKTRGSEVMLNMDTHQSPEEAWSLASLRNTPIVWFGVIEQNHKLYSTQGHGAGMITSG